MKALGEDELDPKEALRLASRMENSPEYREIQKTIMSDMYISFAVDRYRVLGEVRDIALDGEQSARNKIDAAKVFLENTKNDNILTSVSDEISEQRKILERMEKALTNKADDIDSADNLLDVINADIVDES
jgi:hypothetical protein